MEGSIFIYVIIGFFSGILSGIGIGGGTILIPALTTILGYSQQSAQSANLIYFIPTASIAIITHARNGNIKSDVLPKLIIFGAVGAAAGAMIAVNLEGDLLRKLFGWFLACMGTIEFFKKG